MPLPPKEKDLLNPGSSSTDELNSIIDEQYNSVKADFNTGNALNENYTPSSLGLDRKEKYDDYLDLNKTNVFTQDVNKMRADRQSGIEQALNAIAGGVASGLATAAESGSYLLDFENHINWVQGKDTWEKNWLAKEMGKFKEGLEESMPIYREDPSDTFDWDDPAFYWGSLKGIIDSAVGFGLPGGAIAKGVGLAMRASRLNALVQLASKSGQAGASVTESVLAGGIQNYAEGKIMGIEAFENTEKELNRQVSEGLVDLTPEEIKTAAGKAADDMLMYNRALIASDALGLHGILKGVGSTRNILKDPSRTFTNRFKDFGKSIIAPNTDNVVIQGLKESAEEIAQNAIQMESEYQAIKLSGADISKYEEDFGTRVSGFLTSDQALLEGMMGFFGGGPQRILSEAMAGNFTKSGRESLKKAYENQQASLGEISNFIEGRSEKYANIIDRKNKALSEGKVNTAKSLEKELFTQVAIDAFENGTTEELESKLQGILSGDVTDVQKENWSENYSEKTSSMLEQLKFLEKEYIKRADRPNAPEIVREYANYKLLKERVGQANEKLNEYKGELESTANQLIGTSNFKPKKKRGESVATPFTYELDNIETNPYSAKTDKAAYAQYNLFLNKLKETEEFNEYLKLHKYLNEGSNVKGASKKSLKDQLVNAKKSYDISKTNAAAIKYLQNKQANQKDSDESVKKSYEEASIKSNELVKDNKYRDSSGKDWTFEKVEDDGRILMKSPTGQSYTKFTPEKFDSKFKDGEGNFNARVDKVEAVNAQTKSDAKEAQDKAKRTPEPIKTSSEKKAASNPTSEYKGENYEPVNPVDNADDKANEKLEVLEANKSDSILSLSWLSFNNFGKGRNGHPDITEFLERKNKDLVGTNLKISIGLPITSDTEADFYIKAKDLKDRFDNRQSLSKEERNKLIEDLIEAGAIKVSFVGEDGKVLSNNGTNIEGFIHLPNFKKNNAKYKEYTEKLRRDIVTDLMNNKPVTSTIQSKSNGHIQNDDKLNGLGSMFDNTKDIELSIRYSTGGFATGVNEDNEIVEDTEFYKYNNNDAAKGAIFAKVTTANGETFPLRLHASKISEDEAELIYLIYTRLLDKDISPNAKLSLDINKNIRMFVESSSDPKVNGLIKVLPDKNDSTLLDLLNYLVYEGKTATSSSKFPLYLENGKVNYGVREDGSTNYFVAKNAENKKELFKGWLMGNKLRNIKFKEMNSPAYKKYLLDNNVLETTARPSTTGEGPMFAQPTFIMSTPSSKETFTESTTDKQPLPEDIFIDESFEEVEKFGVSEDKSKKADIEREREEELKQFDRESLIEQIRNEPLDLSADGIHTVGQFLDSEDLEASYIISSSIREELSKKGQDAVTFLDWLDTSPDYINGLINKVHAKYDAELAALKPTQQASEEVIDIDNNPNMTNELALNKMNDSIVEITESREFSAEKIASHVPELAISYQTYKDAGFSNDEASDLAISDFKETLRNC